MLTLYDAARCPYAARVRIVLAEKGLPHDTVEIDLQNRPAWLYAKNPAGRVPVLEEDGGLILPESLVIAAYLDERYPEPPLLPADPAERALARLVIQRFDTDLGNDYYAARRREAGSESRFADALARLDLRLQHAMYLTGTAYGLADIAYVPWIVRAESLFGVDLAPYEAVSVWLRRVGERPAVAAELELVAGL